MAEDLNKRVKDLEDRVTTLERRNLVITAGLSKKDVLKLLNEFETKLRKELGGEDKAS
jgi:hypothetical protein